MADGTILLTIFLKHDQSKNLEQIQGHLDKMEWWDRFPPKGAEIVSWNVVMGIGQIVTLRLPPELVNVVNVEIERSAWGVFATEFYPTYDFVPVRERLAREKSRARGKGAPTVTRFAIEPRQFAVQATPWENELADVLEECFAGGTHDLAGIAAALNATRVRAPDGAAWTAATLRAALARLGA